MKLTHILGNTYVLEGWAMIPLYKLDDTHCILLDCGLTEEREKIETALADHHLTPVGIIASHAHGDHSGNCRYFQQMYNIPIAMPMGEAGLCYSLLTLKSYFYMSSPNSILSVSDMVLDVDCPISRRDGPFYFQGATFQIIHTPGHSPDHVAIVTPDNVCYAGDAVLTNPPFPSGRPLRFPFAVAVQPTLDSLEKLIGANAAFYVVAHRGVFSDITPVAEVYRNIILDVSRQLAALITAPMTESEIVYAVCEKFHFLSSRVGRANNSIRTLHTYLDFLVDRGDITIVAHRGMRYFQPTPKLPTPEKKG